MPLPSDPLTGLIPDGQSAPSDASLTRLLGLCAEASSDSGGPVLAALTSRAGDIARRRFGNRIAACAIVNAKSGRCTQDCAFCAQSGHHGTDAPEFDFIGVPAITAAVRAAKAAGARSFGVVVSGLSPNAAELNDLLAAVRAVAASGLSADLSPGVLDDGQLLAFKAAGLARYHHNLETSRRHYASVCSTRSWDDNRDAVARALRLGVGVCSGCLFGLGENWEDRADLLLTLRALGVTSVPVNFLCPIPGTPLADQPRLSPEEALAAIALARILLPDAHIRLAGGRAETLGPRRADALTSGASGIMIGDYLTRPGSRREDDEESMRRAGLKWEEPGEETF